MGWDCITEALVKRYSIRWIVVACVAPILLVYMPINATRDTASLLLSVVCVFAVLDTAFVGFLVLLNQRIVGVERNKGDAIMCWIGLASSLYFLVGLSFVFAGPGFYWDVVSVIVGMSFLDYWLTTKTATGRCQEESSGSHLEKR